MWNFEISCKSKIELPQINIPSDLSDKHYYNDIEVWPLRVIKISEFRVFYFSVFFYKKYSFSSLFQ